MIGIENFVLKISKLMLLTVSRVHILKLFVMNFGTRKFSNCLKYMISGIVNSSNLEIFRRKCFQYQSWIFPLSISLYTFETFIEQYMFECNR